MPNTANTAKKPRKMPRQSRSRALVDAIVEATTRVLPDRGLDQTTTNQIAEVAGVSIGSLYQYFPNKDAILAHLIEKDLTAQEEAFRKIVEDKRDLSLEGVVAAIVEHATDRYLAHPRLVRAVFVHAPRLQQLKTILDKRQSVGSAFAQLIRERDEITIADEDAEEAAFILINAVMGIYQTWVLSESDDSMSREALNRHLVRMIQGYLLR